MLLTELAISSELNISDKLEFAFIDYTLIAQSRHKIRKKKRNKDDLLNLITKFVSVVPTNQYQFFSTVHHQPANLVR